MFLTWRNWLNIIDQITVLGILAVGMTAVIIIAGIDLSVGSILAFSMMMMGWLFRFAECLSHWPSLAGGTAVAWSMGFHYQSEAATLYCQL